MTRQYTLFDRELVSEEEKVMFGQDYPWLNWGQSMLAMAPETRLIHYRLARRAGWGPVGLAAWTASIWLQEHARGPSMARVYETLAEQVLPLSRDVQADLHAYFATEGRCSLTLDEWLSALESGETGLDPYPEWRDDTEPLERSGEGEAMPDNDSETAKRKGGRKPKNLVLEKAAEEGGASGKPATKAQLKKHLDAYFAASEKIEKLEEERAKLLDARSEAVVEFVRGRASTANFSYRGGVYSPRCELGGDQRPYLEPLAGDHEDFS